jgi:AcrR family transcriptional regulator
MARGAATRERILDAAAALMRARGPAGASTRAIARAANLTEAALYRHFSSKEELLGCVLAERMPQFLDVIKDLQNRVGQSSVRDTLEEFARAAVAFYEQLAPMLASIGSDPALLTQLQASLRESGLGPHMANRSLAAYLRAEQAQARLTPAVDADAAATLLLGACFEQGFFRHLYGRDVLLPASDRFAPALVEALLHGAGTESAR